MFKKMAENARNVVVHRRNLDVRMEYNDTDASSVKKYSNQKEEKLLV
jgi:hypothetical protein